MTLLVCVFYEPVGSLHWGCLINECGSRAALFFKTAARKFQGDLKFVKRLLLFVIMDICSAEIMMALAS